jgi:hypothetical protein
METLYQHQHLKIEQTADEGIGGDSQIAQLLPQTNK